MIVDLPAPVDPTIATFSPGLAEKFIPFKTSSLLLPEPNPFFRLSTCSTSLGIMIGLNSYCIFEQYKNHFLEYSFRDESDIIWSVSSCVDSRKTGQASPRS